MDRNDSINKDVYTKHPLVSIILPVYNCEKFIGEALESIFTDTYKPKEIIVVDDGSTDNSARIASGFTDVKIISRKHKGVSVARNVGIKAAKGAYITFLDSDDIWIPDRLKYTIGYFSNHPNIEYVLGKQQMFLENDCPKPPSIKQEWLDNPQNGSGTCVLMVKKSCFDRVGLFNPDYNIGEDTEWLLRANEANIPMARIPLVIIKRRIHGANLTVR